jgi:dihydropteroate synthase type 2
LDKLPWHAQMPIGIRAVENNQSMASPRLLGIVNITEDSFSDGGRFLEHRAAAAQADSLLEAGADVIDLGAIASNPDAARVSIETEIERLAPVISHLHARGALVSVDTFRPEAQRYALSRGVAFLNDIHGFPHPTVYPALAASTCGLIAMHSLHGPSHVTRADIPVPDVVDTIIRFFENRLAVLEGAGIARQRVIVDPGMGFFLGANPHASFAALAGIDRIKRALGQPLLVSVSRKSFLRSVAGQPDAARAGPATLAAEIYAALRGADFIRTHDVAALADAMKVFRAVQSAEVTGSHGTLAPLNR